MTEKLRNRGGLDWQEVKRLRQEGLTYRAIGDRLGVPATSVYYAVNAERQRRRRRHRYGAVRPMREPWTQEEVISAFQAFRRQHGRSPRVDDLGSEGLPWWNTVARLFGRLSAAQTAAGLEARPVGQPRKPDPWEESSQVAA
jgi:hypothetical protein